MQILKEIKLSRLVLAIAITLLIADTVPHPSLSDGLLENSWNLMTRVQQLMARTL
ncbi:MAG: hypothetical protein AAGF01_23550 [Cyanobacteria bacterium P01_G01_bin.38]